MRYRKEDPGEKKIHKVKGYVGRKWKDKGEIHMKKVRREIERKYNNY
jgi:hypothetical protein